MATIIKQTKMPTKGGTVMDFNCDENENTFPIQCEWCGAKIRDDKDEDTAGVCLQCFYQILSNHLSAQKRSPYGEFVSDR